MAKRFSRLKYALKVNDGGATDGSALKKFKDYATGVVKPTYVTSASSLPGELKEIGIIAFSDSDNVYRASISKRSQDQIAELTNLSATTTLYHQTIDGTTLSNPGFTPARAIVNTSGTGTSTETSKITGLQYKKETGAASYTLPFGNKPTAATTDTFLSRAAAIRAVIEAITEASVSFQPERFRLS
jgi:hypothetical protein